MTRRDLALHEALRAELDDLRSRLGRTASFLEQVQSSMGPGSGNGAGGVPPEGPAAFEERCFQQFVDVMPQVAWSARPDGSIDFVNRSWVELTGLEASRSPGPPRWHELVHSDDLARIATGWRTAIETGVPLQVEVRMGTRDGRQPRWFLARACPFRDSQGRIHRWFGTATDIHDYKLVEGASYQLEALAQCTHVGLTTTDPQGVFTSWSPGAERLFGYSAPEMVGRPFDVLVPPERHEDIARIRAGMQSGERIPPFETVRLSKDRKPLHVLLSISPMRDREGGLLGFAAVVQDLGPVRELESRMGHTRKLEAMGRLAGGIAHEFSNLLTIIRGYCDLILEGGEAEGSRAASVSHIRKAGERAAELTRSLLAFGRKQVMEPRRVDLNEVVRGAEDLLRRVIGEDVDLDTDVDAEPGPIFADPCQLEQVVMQLVLNARDAMPRGGRLIIGTRRVVLEPGVTASLPALAPGAYVQLFVSDTGKGMDEETRERIFEPFFTTKEPGAGTGLGLSTVYGIVTQSGGRIHVESARGEGSTFQVFFPACSELTSPGAAEATRQTGMDVDAGTIVLVEDDDLLRTLTGKVLRSRGFEVLEASRGADALAACRDGRPDVDLLLTDVVMPDMGGAELARQMSDRCPELKVIYMSGYTDEAVTRHGVFESQVHFLQKPFSPDDLVRKIRKVLAAPILQS